VHHPDGPVVFDTGIGSDVPRIADRLLHFTDIVEALNDVGVDERDVAAVVNCHLHFDHCGQNARFEGTPVYVQRDELTAAETPGFTIAEWAAIPPGDQRVLDGDASLAAGLLLAATPGHTPGHQSLIVSSDDAVVIVAGQCGYCAAEFATGVFPESELHDPSRQDEANRSLDRLRSLHPATVYFGHDAATYETSAGASR
jgi:glyoxylase-like metal-dependent hydrolase (beta-lactamase superfamily II)